MLAELEQQLILGVSIHMTTAIILPMLIAIATMFGCMDSAYAQSPEADANRKLALAAAKGELSSQQVIVFQEQIRAATKTSTGLARQQRLAKIAQNIERARKQKQLADRLFNWF